MILRHSPSGKHVGCVARPCPVPGPALTLHGTCGARWWRRRRRCLGAKSKDHGAMVPEPRQSVSHAKKAALWQRWSALPRAGAGARAHLLPQLRVLRHVPGDPAILALAAQVPIAPAAVQHRRAAGDVVPAPVAHARHGRDARLEFVVRRALQNRFEPGTEPRVLAVGQVAHEPLSLGVQVLAPTLLGREDVEDGPERLAPRRDRGPRPPPRALPPVPFVFGSSRGDVFPGKRGNRGETTGKPRENCKARGNVRENA